VDACTAGHVGAVPGHYFGLHSDNSSECVNHTVSKLTTEIMGHTQTAAGHAAVEAFYHEHFNPS
jgi:hypothetical protein